jgi:hypothetical protein
MTEFLGEKKFKSDFSPSTQQEVEMILSQTLVISFGSVSVEHD